MPTALGTAFAKLRSRADSEHEMSLNRLAFGVLILACQVLVLPPDPAAARLAVALWGALSLGVFLHILMRPESSPTRRAVALLFDTGFLSWYLHIGGEAHAVFFAIYLWIVFGNGFRFGLASLRAAMAAALVGFSAVVLTTPFWLDQPHLSVGLLAGLVVLPLYVGALIRKLSDAHRAAEAASQAKSLFLANVSHELRTPLNAIIGMGELFRDTRLDADQRDMVRTIDVAATSLLDLIDDILDLSRIEAGRMPVRIEVFDLAGLLGEIRSLIAAQARLRGLRVGLHIGTGVPARIAADRRNLREILVNLAGNAVKFTERGGVSIALCGEPAGTGRVRLRFEVSDTGIGIAPAAQARIFESFTQADPGVVSRFGGTGLGLAICRRLAELLGGRIGVESAPGAGSTFWLELEAGCVEAEVAVPADAAGGVILLAGDEVTARIRPTLHALDLAAHRASSFEDAKRQVAAHGWPVLAETRLVPGAEAEGDLGFAVPPWPELPLVLVSGKQVAGLPRGPARWASGMVSADSAPAQLALALRLAGLSPAENADLEVWPDKTSAGEDLPARRMRVLVADDNAVNRKVAARILERAGHDVDMVEHGEAALDALASSAAKGRDFDLVLMDVNMPVMDGIEATKLFRFERLGRPIRVPVLGLTADATPETSRRCIEAGMDGCVVKPVRPKQLLEAIAHVLPPPAARAEVAELAHHPSFRPAPQPPLNAEAIEQLRDLGGVGFVAEVAGDFLREGTEALRSLTLAATAGDAAEFRSQAHALGSIAANIGARPLQAACSAAQRFGQSEFLVRAGGDVEAIAAEFERVRQALRDLRGAA